MSGPDAKAPLLSSPHVASVLPALVHGTINTMSGVFIVVANKQVMTIFGFRFPIFLTWLHSIVTLLGMLGMAAAGMFEVKRLPWVKTAPLAACYIAFIVFNNYSIQVNTVGFYQISKILITPCVVAIERVLYGKTVGRQKSAAVCLLLVGITVATVTDSQVASNVLGILMAAGAVGSSALYQVWAGAKQTELQVNGKQLLHQVVPSAVMLLAVLVPTMEPLGLIDPQQGTVLGFEHSAASLSWILVSSLLGLVVTLSAYLFIGATSPLTYNVVGHMKTLLIIASGVLFFGDSLGPKKLAGLACAVAGIALYTTAPAAAASSPAVGSTPEKQADPQKPPA